MDKGVIIHDAVRSLRTSKGRTLGQLVESDEELKTISKNGSKQKQIESLIALLLTEGLEVDLNDPNFSETPQRVAKMFVQEVFSGLFNSPPQMKMFPKQGQVDELILVKIPHFTSYCAHHLVPFHGSAVVGYLPGKSITGLSKIVRVFDHFAARPTLQENLTRDVAQYIYKQIKPRGVGVITRAEHMCMSMRGVKKHGSEAVSSCMLGKMRSDTSLKAEFLSLIQTPL